jgi:hypothetical protein
MNVGDSVRLTGHRCHGIHGGSEEAGGTIINISTHVETYSSSGCLEYLVLLASGERRLFWQGDLLVISKGQ